MSGQRRCAPHKQGQTTVEFSLVSLALLAFLLGVIDLGRAAYLQNSLDSGAADLARNLAAISGTTTSGSQYIWTQPALNPTSSTLTLYQGSSTTVQSAIQAALVHANSVAGNVLSTTPLTPTAAFSSATTTISNTQVIVTGSPNLTAPTSITVSVSAPFTPVIGRFLPIKTFTLRSQESAIPVQGLTAGY